jgi:hypothetical protein
LHPAKIVLVVPSREAAMESLPMNRVAILGCCGSGKSHVARTLSRLLGTAVTYLDAVYYDDEWNPLPPEEFEAAQRELVAAPRWIIDGNYNSTRAGYTTASTGADQLRRRLPAPDAAQGPGEDRTVRPRCQRRPSHRTCRDAPMA